MTSKAKPADKPLHAGHRLRLKGRLRNSGRKALADYELLELLLAYAIPRKDTKPLAKILLKKFRTFQAVFDATYEKLEAIQGMGGHVSTLIGLMKACMGRYMETAVEGAPLITGPEDVVSFLRTEIGGSVRERFMLLCLNAAGRLVNTRLIAEGTVDAAHVYPREVIQAALESNATAVILVHNHPSGTLKASEHDLRLTRTLTDICAQVGISLHDHLIVSLAGTYSIKLGSSIDIA